MPNPVSEPVKVIVCSPIVLKIWETGPAYVSGWFAEPSPQSITTSTLPFNGIIISWFSAVVVKTSCIGCKSVSKTYCSP